MGRNQFLVLLQEGGWLCLGRDQQCKWQGWGPQVPSKQRAGEANCWKPASEGWEVKKPQWNRHQECIQAFVYCSLVCVFTVLAKEFALCAWWQFICAAVRGREQTQKAQAHRGWVPKKSLSLARQGASSCVPGVASCESGGDLDESCSFHLAQACCVALGKCAWEAQPNTYQLFIYFY